MADFATLTPIAVAKRNTPTTAATYSALTTALASNGTAYGATLTMNARDDKYLFLITNSHATAAKSVTVKAGNGEGSGKDLVVSDIPAGKYVLLSLDSWRFKNLNGSDKGKLIFTGTDDNIGIAVFLLP